MARHTRQGPWVPGQPVLANLMPSKNSASVTEMATELLFGTGGTPCQRGVGSAPDRRIRLVSPPSSTATDRDGVLGADLVPRG
jgi:hypothetical protein